MKLILSRIIKDKLYLSVFILFFIFLLSIYGLKGTYSRYAQDDYCYSYRVNDYGFINSQISSYFYPTEFNSNRYSLTFAASTIEALGGPAVAPVVPALEIIAWAVCLGYPIYQLLNGKKSFLKIAVAALSALGILFFTFYLSGNLYEVLFWLNGMQTYLTPMVLYTLILGRLVALTRSPTVRTRHYIEIALLALITGGFSETTTLWMFVFLGLILFTIFLARKYLPGSRLRSRLVITAMVATGIALIILIICPANYYRSATWTRPDFPTLVRMSLYYGEEFIRVSIKDTPLPFAILSLLGFWLGNLYEPGTQRKLRVYLVTFILSVAFLFILSITTMVPTEYAMSTYAGDRARLPALFSLVAFSFSTGWLAAWAALSLLPRITSTKLYQPLLMLVGLILFAYIVRTTPQVYDKMPLYQARAQGWDIRNQMILNAKAAGQTQITVPQFDSVYGITELKPESDNWVNTCAANYYGVQSITAVENYDGMSIYPIGK